MIVPPRSFAFSAAAAAVVFAASATAQLQGTATFVDGRKLAGSLSVGTDGSLTLSTEQGEVVAQLGDLLSFDRDSSTLREVRVEHRIWLRSGAELPVRKLVGRAPSEGKPAVVVARLPSGLELELPITMLRAVRHGGLSRPKPARFDADLAEPLANNDLIYVVNDGEAHRATVSVTAITPKTIDFLLRGEIREFDFDGLAAVVFGRNTGFAPDRQPLPRVQLQLTTGERIEGRLLAVGETIVCRLDEGCRVEVPAAKLHRLEVASDKLVWLSGLVPEVDQTPAFDRVWPWRIDRCEAGPGFLLSGQRFTRGIGMVPRTRLTYDIGGRFDLFESTIGIDDRGGPQAHAVFRVFVDGKLQFESEPMTRSARPRDVRVEIAGAQQLAIEVDFGKNYDLGDFCAFADARVLQQ